MISTGPGMSITDTKTDVITRRPGTGYLARPYPAKIASRSTIETVTPVTARLRTNASPTP
jgi:hypothetical protein